MSSQHIHSDPNEGSHSDTGSFGKSKIPKVVEQFKKSESVHKRTLNKRVKLKDLKFDVEQENPDDLIKQIEQKHVKKRQSVPSFKEWRATTSMNLKQPANNSEASQSANNIHLLSVQQQKKNNRLSSPILRKNETMRDLRSSSSPTPPNATTLAAAANLQRRATLRREMTRKQFENWPQNYKTKAQSITPTLSSSPKLSRPYSPNRTNNTDNTNSPLPPTPSSSTSDSLPSLPLSEKSSVNASLPSIPSSPITPFVSPTRSQIHLTRPTDTSSSSPGGPLSSSNVEDPRKVQTPPSHVHKIQIPLPEVLDTNGSLDVAIVQPADITPADNNILNDTIEPDEIPQEEFEEEQEESENDESLDHILLSPLPNITTMTDINHLKEILEAERKHHRDSKEKVRQQKDKVRQTKQGMRSLLAQLSGYKKVIEDEHGEIQAELESVSEELNEIAEIKENLIKQETLFKEEIADLQHEIAQRKEEYVQELQSLTGSRRNGERETLNSMRAYIDELTNLEQVNETLNEALAQNNAALEKERDDHLDSLRLLDILRARNKQDMTDVEEVKLTNEVLLKQIKAANHANATTNEPPRLSLNLSRVSSFDNSAPETAIHSQNSSPGATPDPSPRNVYDPYHRMSLPVGRGGALDPMAKASWGNLMDAFNRDLEAPGEKGFFLVRKCSPEHPGSVRCMLIVEDNLWVGCGNGAIRIWSMQTGQMLEDLKAHADGIYDMKLVKDHVWTCSKDKSIHVFNIKKLRAGPVKKLAAGNSFCVCLVEVDGRVWSGHINGEIRVWSTNHYKVKKQISEGQTIGSFLKRGNVVWIGTEDNIVVYDYQTLKPKGTLMGHKNTVNCLASVGPYEVWSCSSDQTVRCWNPDSFECMKVLQADSKVFALMEVRSVNLVFCGCWGKTILVWNSNTYEIVQKLESSHKDATACFSLDKHNQVWSGSWDGTVDIWRYGVLSPKIQQ